ncbi:LacI family DNA-binding transcriptional regulator [Ruania zhangjianzhongii]|uniref:LacI family DNA-binding transcriptional regulator n=1 Tax=Ruania zhangjianzhongii TaxID=2603206 RepID=UPI0011CC831D|nr:LacI family DNA-binding transcriptional regulator [Ruania zhangjianzhongii]
MRRATIYSIAAELGISASTVSRAFSRPDLVRDSVRQRILDAADQIGYQPSRAARSVATGRTGLVGLLVPDITNPFVPPLVRAIEMAAAERQAGVLLVDARANGAAEPGLVVQLKAQVDGLVIVSPRASASALSGALGSTAAVVVNRVMRGMASVVCDNTVAIERAVQALVADGHETLALLRGPADAWASKRRAEAFRRAAADAGVRLLEHGPFEAQFEDGRAAAEAVAASEASAVLAFDDLMACGVIAGLTDAGLRVPYDVSVLGCDDVLLARTMTPALSTISAPIGGLGERAVELLDEVMAGARIRQERLEGALALRGTTAVARPRKSAA